MDGPRPSRSTPPSIWEAEVATPHRKPSGKRISYADAEEVGDVAASRSARRSDPVVGHADGGEREHRRATAARSVQPPARARRRRQQPTATATARGRQARADVARAARRSRRRPPRPRGRSPRRPPRRTPGCRRAGRAPWPAATARGARGCSDRKASDHEDEGEQSEPEGDGRSRRRTSGGVVVGHSHEPGQQASRRPAPAASVESMMARHFRSGAQRGERGRGAAPQPFTEPAVRPRTK